MSASREPTSKPARPQGSSNPPPATPPLRQPPARPAAKPAESTNMVPTAPLTDDNLESAALQPIPPPSDRLQFRAIGLVRGCYTPSEERFNRGTLTTEDGTELDAVLLGQVISLVKKHLELDQEHLWVVYPRTREKQRSLHVQILGVWEPEKLHKDELSQNPSAFDSARDGYFSIRGELVFQSPEKGFVVIKIQQSSRKTPDESKSFKLRLEGTVAAAKGSGYFWEIEAQRENNQLMIVNATSVALLPPRIVKKSDRDRQRPSRERGSARPPRPGGKFTPPRPADPAKPFIKPTKRNSTQPED
jgi:hypothetical protein